MGSGQTGTTTCLSLCGTRLVRRMPRSCYMFVVSHGSGPRHTSNVHRVCIAVPWAIDVAHGKPNGTDRLTWRVRLSTYVFCVPWAKFVCSRERGALAVCVVCAVRPVSRLTAQSDRRGVFSSCREPGKLARGIQAWSRVLLVCREPPRKLTAKRHLYHEPDVWFTAAKSLTAALGFR
jgi:hypothetical protein